MRSTRRRFLSVVSVGSVTLLAGCQDMVTGDGVELSAEPAQVSQDAIDDSIYEFQELEAYEIDEEFSVGGETRSVKASSWVASYTVSITGIEDFHDDPDATQETLDEIREADVAAFTVISTPSEKIAGREINPVAHLSDEDLIDRLGDEIDEGRLVDVAAVDEYSQAIFGQDTTVNVLSATAIANTTDGDEEYDILLHLAEVPHEEDIILSVGIHHVDLDERSQFEEFMANIEHPV